MTSLKPIVKNISWQFFYRIARLGLAFFITAWMARYLGPERYGQLVYAIAIAELVMLFWTQGLKEVVVQQIKESGLSDLDVTVASFHLMLIGNTILYGILFALVFISNLPEDIKILTLICGLGIWFRCFEAFELWFHSNLNVRIPVQVQLISQLVYMGLNLGFILYKVDVLWFGISYMLQLVLTAIGFFSIFLIKKKVIILELNLAPLQKKLLRLGLFMILAKLALTSSILIDRLIIEQMLGIEFVGVYTASMKMITTWVFISSAISLSFIPILTDYKTKSDFERLSGDMFGWISTISILLSVLFYTFSADLVLFVFGDQYSESVEIFKILLLCLPFLFLHEAVKSWIIIENLSSYYILSMVSITVMSIGLNLYLIPKYNLDGAAISFAFAWFLGGFIIFFFFKKTRPLALHMVQSFFYPILKFKRLINN